MDTQDFELFCKTVTALERIADALETLTSDSLDDNIGVSLRRISNVLENFEQDGVIRVVQVVA
jgi:hypothetical protein